MRVVVQGVGWARVLVAGEPIATIGRGLLLLVGFAPGDGERELAWMARKLAGLRIFPDAAGQMNAALADVGGAVLAVAHFTLLGGCRKGRRPSFGGALPAAPPQPVLSRFAGDLYWR